jgi:hypothetical protein
VSGEEGGAAVTARAFGVFPASTSEMLSASAAAAAMTGAIRVLIESTKQRCRRPESVA